MRADRRFLSLFPIVALATATAACDGLNNTLPGDDGGGNPVIEPDFELQLLHFADVDGGGTAALANVDAFSALVDAFRAQRPDSTVLLSSGDNYIPGPIYQASAEDALANAVGVPGVGRGEVAILNALGLQASAVGNHDLDGGPGEFAGIIGADDAWSGAAFPYLSSNLDFGADDSTSDLANPGGSDAADIAGELAPSAVLTVGGERIGVVGAVTPTLPSITSTGSIGVAPDDVSDALEAIDALAAAIQPAVDALSGDGIDKIIVLAHMQQIAVEQALATRLENVDIIVAGGSNTLLADANDDLRPGDSAADDYPLVYRSPSDEPVLLVNVDGDYKYLGRLIVGFDESGVILEDTLDPADNGAWAAIDSVVDSVQGAPIGDVVDVADALRGVLGDKDGVATGITEVFLDGRRGSVRTEETNLGNLTADANLWYARRADEDVVISLKNGGGIRAAIGTVTQPAGSNDPDDVVLGPPDANDFGKPAGGVSQLDIETALAFNNGVAMVTLTAAELRDVMEHAVSAFAPGVTAGQFPQIGGMAFSFDPGATARSGGDTNQGAATTGERIRTLVVTQPGGGTDTVVAGGALQGNPSRTFRMAVLNFLVGCVPDSGGEASDDCGDGYPFKGLSNPQRADLDADFDAAEYDAGAFDFSPSGGEQDALAEYLAAFHADAGSAFDAAEQAPADDARIQNLDAREDGLAGG
ncbi:5'-nucleotidase C-terminal domain-containing protein [Algiphilus sp.]|uniref:bifunctional metallophosphatase/5'-nucleotidase n=1 Tax=Algiphilus sp. TaxID=1872431 RepID=UPI0025C091A7|nr:5'-nucleotidase C-terminal domain-containing protein [Algiphilus sp.]MCK5769409.1 5'-nucleotidase C-terminal domain-containing protein [Algiphilus sp.]